MRGWSGFWKHVSRFLTRLIHIRLPSTLWGFPVESDEKSKAHPLSSSSGGENSSAPGEALLRRRGERGIALLIAIMIISIMMLFTSELILMSQVNITLATHQRDNVKAEFLAKSGLNAAMLLVASDKAFDLYQAQQNPKLCFNDGMSDIWSALNGFPIGAETMEMAQKFQEEFGLNAVLDSGIIDQLKMFEGLFTIQVEDEAKRINLNNCFQGRCPEILAMLEALFSCPAEKLFLEQKKVTGPELVYRIKDYIDQDKRAEAASGFSDENEPYTKRQPRMQAKNAPLDSIDELRVIEGWDEEVHAVFAPYLTAYPFVTPNNNDRTKVKLNINTTSRALLQCLFPEARGSCEEKFAQNLVQRDRDGTPFAIPGVNMKDVLRDQLCYTGGGGGAEGGDKSDWFGRSTEVFRVTVEGTSGDSVKKVMAVVERVMPDPKKNEKSTYRLLYWKLI